MNPIEQMARAVCAFHGLDPDEVVADRPQWKRYEREQEAAFKAFCEAMGSAKEQADD